MEFNVRKINDFSYNIMQLTENIRNLRRNYSVIDV